jgi:hypothetical protein
MRNLRLFWLIALMGLSAWLAGCGNRDTGREAPQAYPTAQNQSALSGLPAHLPQQFAPGFSRLPMMASKTGKVVHRRDCALTDAIPAPDREYFRAYPQAAGKGYQACGVCRPDQP